MSKVLTFGLLAILLAACGVDGEPTPPTITGETKFGVNSNRGAFTTTDVALEIGLG